MTIQNPTADDVLAAYAGGQSLYGREDVAPLVEELRQLQRLRGLSPLLATLEEEGGILSVNRDLEGQSWVLGIVWGKQLTAYSGASTFAETLNELGPKMDQAIDDRENAPAPAPFTPSPTISEEEAAASAHVIPVSGVEVRTSFGGPAVRG